MNLNIEYFTTLTERDCEKSDIENIRKVNDYLFEYIKSEINKVHSQLTNRSSIVYKLINDLIFINANENDPVFGNTKYLLAFYSLSNAMSKEKTQNTISNSYLIFKGKSTLYPSYRGIYLNFIRMVPKLNRIGLDMCLYNYELLIKYSDELLIPKRSKPIIDVEKKQIMMSASTQVDESIFDNKHSQKENIVLDGINFFILRLLYVLLVFVYIGIFLGCSITLLISLPGIGIDYLLNHEINDRGSPFTLNSMRIMHSILGSNPFPGKEIIHGGFFMKFPFGIIGELVGECVGMAVIIPAAIIIASLILVVKIVPLTIFLVYKLISRTISVILDSLYEFGDELITGPKYN